MIGKPVGLLSLEGGRILMLGVVAFSILAIWPTWPSLERVWFQTTDYQHGYLVAVVSAVWIFLVSKTLPAMPARPSIAAGVALILALLAWLIAHRAGSAIGEQIVAPAVLGLAVWLACGRAVAVCVAPPIAYLYFAIPIWDLMLPILQAGTIWASGTGLGWMDIPVTIRGDLVSIPEGTFQVVEGCAGKRFLLISMAIGSLLAASLNLPWRRTVLLLAISAALAIIGNWIRVITIIYAGHVSNMQHYLVAREHMTFGWVVYLFLCISVCYIGSRLARSPAASTSAPVAEKPSFAFPRAALVTTFATLLLAPAGMAYSAYLLPSSAMDALSPPAATAGHWIGPYPADEHWTPKFRDAESSMRASYRSRTETVEVFAARYLRQHQGVELINEANTLLGPWRSSGSDFLVPRRSTESFPDVRAIRATSTTGEPWLVSYVYQVGNVVTGSGVNAQLAYGFGSWTQDRPASVIAAAMRCASSCEHAARQLVGFWNDLGPRLLGDAAAD
jgi:exosortase A